MRSISILLLAVALFSMGTGCALLPAGSSSEEKIAAAAAIDSTVVTTFNKGDLNGVMAVYWNSPDLVVYPPGELEAHGWQAAHDAYGRALKFMPGAQLQMIGSRYLVVGDDVIGSGLWKMNFPAAGPDMTGRYTEVMAKKDGKWVIVLDHISAPLPETGPASAPAK